MTDSPATPDTTIPLDIVIPVFNEGTNIINVLESFRLHVKTPYRVLICYDFEEDNTLEALRSYDSATCEIIPVKNTGRGPHAAILTGFKASTASAVLVFPADDLYNAGIIDALFAKHAQENCEVVAASRFMPGGRMEDCPWLKSVLVRTASFTLYYIGRLPVHDATNGLRLFSRRTLDTIQIESSKGFVYSLELLVKVHRLGWKIGEVPSVWIERKRHQGKSRFKVSEWLTAYLHWYLYGLATTFLRKREL